MAMIERFLDYLLSERNYSPHTAKSYKRDLLDFKVFYEDTLKMKDMVYADKNAVRQFIMALVGKGLSKRSINRKISALKSFYLFLHTIGVIDCQPTEMIKTIKEFPKRQMPFSEEEMARLADIEQSDNLAHILVETLYQTGMRRAELCNLLYKDVDMDSLLIKVEGKGKKQRLIPIGNDLQKILADYLGRLRPKSEVPYFFLTEKGKKLSEKFVYTKVKSYLSAISQKEKRSPHILRHSFATHLLNNGAEISKVKTLLGHSSLASTQVYTHANIELLKTILKKAHPRGEREEE